MPPSYAKCECAYNDSSFAFMANEEIDGGCEVGQRWMSRVRDFGQSSTQSLPLNKRRCVRLLGKNNMALTSPAPLPNPDATRNAHPESEMGTGDGDGSDTPSPNARVEGLAHSPRTRDANGRSRGYRHTHPEHRVQTRGGGGGGTTTPNARCKQGRTSLLHPHRSRNVDREPIGHRCAPLLTPRDSHHFDEGVPFTTFTPPMLVRVKIHLLRALWYSTIVYIVSSSGGLDGGMGCVNSSCVRLDG